MSGKKIDIVIDKDTAEVKIEAHGFIMGECASELEAIMKMVKVDQETVKEDPQHAIATETVGW